jgi:phosphate-selective porin OprO/OprP
MRSSQFTAGLLFAGLSLSVASLAHAQSSEYSGVPDTYDETKPVGTQAVPLNAKHEMGYLAFESADGNIKYWLDGRIMLDTGAVSNSQDGVDQNSVYSETEFRRLRFAVKGIFYKNWQGELDIDFSDLEDGITAPEVKDAWVAYTGFRNTTIKVGNHKPNFSMDEVTTSRWVNLIERSMISDVFSPGRRIGVSVNNWDTAYMVGATVFGDEYNVEAAREGASERFGWTARGVYRPIVADDGSTILHLGVAFQNRPTQSDDDRLRFRTRAESKIYRAFGPGDDGERYLNTGNFDADSADTIGLEAAVKKGRFYAQAEYMKTDVSENDDDVLGDPEFSGWYVNAAWFLSGGEREYSLPDGEFGRVYPTSNKGAWELVVRYSTLDLNDLSAGIEGGSADNFTLGVNWYINNNFILRANYTSVDNDIYADNDGDFVGNDDLDIFAVRFQYMF